MTNPKKNHLNLINPTGWLKRFRHLIPPGGKVLDLAAGNGRHSDYLLKSGFSVVAIDKNPEPLEFLTNHPNAQIIVTDLEDGSPWPLHNELFDGILVSNYLYRPLFSILLTALAPNGLFLYETFAQGNEFYGSPRNQNYLLKSGELINLVIDRLNIVAYEHGILSLTNGLSVKQRICATNNLHLASRSNHAVTSLHLFSDQD